MKVLTPAEVSASAVEALRLDGELLDLTTNEAIASALRRAAGLLCPCSGRTLVRAVMEPLRGVHTEEGLVTVIEDTLEALVAHGDLLELHDVTQDDATGGFLYAAPPGFVECDGDWVMLLGVAPDGMPFVTEDIEQAVEHVNHVRIIRDGDADLRAHLAELGLISISQSAWLKAPQHQRAGDLIESMRARVDGSPRCGEVPGLRLLDPDTPVRYYRRRWTEPSRHTGQFVARRPQAYGADLWCFVEVEDGQAVRLVDLPTRQGTGRGCDEAWHLQAAIDHERGAPQVYRVRRGPSGNELVDFFSPVPMWAQRRWATFGEPVPAQGCLFSFRFAAPDLGKEIAFARDRLWQEETGQ